MQSNTPSASDPRRIHFSLPVLLFAAVLIACNFARWHSVAFATLTAYIAGFATADIGLFYVYLRLLTDSDARAFREGKDTARELLLSHERLEQVQQRQLDSALREIAHWKGEVFQVNPALRASWVRSIADQYAQSPEHELCSDCGQTGLQRGTDGVCAPCPTCKGLSVIRREPS